VICLLVPEGRMTNSQLADYPDLIFDNKDQPGGLHLDVPSEP